MKNTSTMLSALLLMLLALTSCDTFTDPRDGKVYSKVRIGSQVWMADNLAYKPETGSVAPLSPESENYVQAYGYIYDWNTASRVCPQGWHLPSNEEWQILIEELGGSKVAGGRMKEPGFTHWKEPNGGAGYDSGFRGLPGSAGYNNNVHQYEVGEWGYYWSSTGQVRKNRPAANNILLSYGNGEVVTMTSYKQAQMSVRCLKN